jgi:predicted SAM-dependent methyltransferase
MKILSIGSGTERFSSDVITLDISADAGPDVVWDLNKGPYPFEDGFFDEIHAKDVIEHVNDIIFVMNECHRILKKNGVLKIHTPHFSSADSYTDPTHRQHLSIFSFDFFSKNHLRAYYSKGAFEIILKKIFFKGDSFFI